MRPLLERSLKIQEKTLGPDHPSAAGALKDLAILEADYGESRRAFEAASRSLLSRENQFEANLWSQTESERLRYAATLRGGLEVFLSLARGVTTQDEVTSVVLSWKGRVARSLSDRESQLASLSSEERSIVGQLRSVQKRLSDALYSKEVSDREAHRELLINLRDRRKELELALVRSRGGEKKGIEWERGEEATAVKDSLPQGSVAVSFFMHGDYRPAEWRGRELVRKGAWAPARVSAFVVPGGKSNVQWLDLGEAPILEEATKEFLEELISRRGLVLTDEKTGKSPPTTAATDRLGSSSRPATILNHFLSISCVIAMCWFVGIECVCAHESPLSTYSRLGHYWKTLVSRLNPSTAPTMDLSHPPQRSSVARVVRS